MAAHSILIVDDSQFIIEGLEAMLKRKGYNIVTAHGGDECLHLLKSERPDLILLDIMMEPMDGWETLDRMKSDPLTKNIPVLMFSAKKITPTEAEEHSINIENFISKPVSPAQLVESIEKIFSRRELILSKEMAARDAGFDTTIIEERSALQQSIEIDRNMLTILKISSGSKKPGTDISSDNKAAIQKLEAKIFANEKRLKEIEEKLLKDPDKNAVV